MQINSMRHVSVFLLLIMVLSGCVSVNQGAQLSSRSAAPETDRNAASDRAKITSLQKDLMVLNPYADMHEAGQVAEMALLYSARLAEEYKIVRPAVLHNVLVRMGFKDRGLCHHWTEDLMQQLEQLELKTYQLYWGVAHRGSELREHNSVVIAAKGDSFDGGIVLDPWRYSGRLFWGRVKDDRYPWQERPRHEW